MIVKWFLFKTRLGLFLLSQLEQRVGLAVINAEWLGRQPGGWPVVADQAQ